MEFRELFAFGGAGLVCERLSQRTTRIQDSIEAWCGLALTKDVYANGCKTVRVVTHIFNIPNFTSCF